jgi:hypothetical protein
VDQLVLKAVLSDIYKYSQKIIYLTSIYEKKDTSKFLNVNNIEIYVETQILQAFNGLKPDFNAYFYFEKNPVKNLCFCIDFKAVNIETLQAVEQKAVA